MSIFGDIFSFEKPCELRVEMEEKEMKVLAIFYYGNGRTSYRNIQKYIENKRKIFGVLRRAKRKAAKGCIISETFVSFYYNSGNFINIPFDVFVETSDMDMNLREKCDWHQENEKRILKHYTIAKRNLTKTDDSESHETIISTEKVVPKSNLKAKFIELYSNGKVRLITQTQIITRDIVKSSFGNHKEIYNKQFEILKDNSGDWFVKGYDVPLSAKDSKGNSYRFFKTYYDEKDVTNSYTKLQNDTIIKVGSVEFLVKFKY